MKKIIFLMVMMAGLLSFTESKAQKGVMIPFVAATDTFTTAASLDTVYKILPATAGYSAMGIQVNIVKVSGTVAGKVYLYGSVDGSTYTVTDSSAALSDASQSVFFTKTGGLPYASYKIEIRSATGAATTQVHSDRFWYVLKRFDD